MNYNDDEDYYESLTKEEREQHLLRVGMEEEMKPSAIYL